jgi:Ala-tRNA(Pro) deacylase
MAVRKLKEYLDDNGIRYMSIYHSGAYTSQEIAAAAHIPGMEMAKTVIVKVDGRLAMAVLPSCHAIELDSFKKNLKATTVELAKEGEFADLFPECELGAMPPFGNLWGVDVFVADSLPQKGLIAFQAGTHREVIRMSYKDFALLTQPQVVAFSRVTSTVTKVA